MKIESRSGVAAARRSMSRATVVTTSLTAALFTIVIPAEAVGPRPIFQVPFECGQVWEASTYDGHKPNTNSLDFLKVGGGSNGQPILASAAGTVDYAGWDNGGGWMVNLRHSDGWGTSYLHMIETPAVTAGQAVALGQQLGRVGSTGDSGTPHLHYQQWADAPGNTVRAEFNGVPVNVRVGQPEVLTSQNCGRRGGSLSGDSRADLVSVQNGGLFGYANNGYHSNGTVRWGARVQIGGGWDGVPEAAVKFADLNGDGLTDLVSKQDGGLFGYANNGYNSNGTVRWGPRVQIGGGWEGVPDTAMKYGDLNGDGRTDLMSVQNGGLFGYANNGYNSNGTVRWGPRVQIGGGWEGVPDAALYLGDLNGDGRVDLMSKQDGGLFGYANNGYNSNGTVQWGPRVQIGGGWEGVPDAALYLGDLNGDGRADLMSKQDGGLFGYANDGYNSNGTVRWGSRVQIGGGWEGVPDAALNLV
ncbi:VCBS repeat domain-containing M23 family metallopeptidase [Saccharothrix obliqua]|uniref:VCBS repeat domain-containing M23 family metallopeptidase n=1 Tax=Saccharothrix obliqua TaxID=2861747 RepID=UPI001C5E8CA2|nr:VCBS repeat domain-containing M23 family metallopeptidase [Saccharothrix obliqua]MBW4721566.1 VCBS repeat domain-containing M23 family metallopeptidase [Saccharothrix obliqua]